MRSARGFTVLELIVAMTLVCVLMALTAPRFVALRDRAAVRAAMGELGAVFSFARHTAVARRTAVAIVLDTATGVVEVHTSGQLVARHGLHAVYGIVLGTNKDSTVYDARGLGYGFANLTVTVSRGAFVDTLTMSRLGRTRW